MSHRQPRRGTEERSSGSCFHALADGSELPGGCKIKEFYTVDLSGRWRPIDALELFGTVENLFDKVALVDPHTYGAVNYNPLDASGAIGRYFSPGLKYDF